MGKRGLQGVAERFHQEGFVIIPHLFEREEVTRFKEEIQRILADVRQEALKAGKDPQQILKTGVYVGLAARSAFFRQAVQDPRLLDILEEILEPPIEFLSDKVVFKDPSTTFGTPWHQDWPYWKGSHKISVWVALDDATRENGCLKLIPGSHKQLVIHDGDASDGLGFGNRVRPEAIDESQAVTAELEAGGAIFFHDLLLHASYPNRALQERWVWIPTYRSAKAEDPPYPWAVAARIVRQVKEG